jgi:hypothetical protein
MKKNICIIIGTGIIVIICSWFIFSNGFWKNNTNKADIVQQTVGEEVVLTIDDGGGSPDTFTTEFKEGMTAFDLLKGQAGKSVLTLKTKSYDTGIFIEAIGAKENGQDGKYWLYYVNGQMPMVSADKQFLKAGDKVEFKFEKSSF